MKVLVTGAFNEFNKLEKKLIEAKYTFIQNELEELTIDVSEYEYVICNALFLYNDISKFKSLKYIQVTSAGLDRLPMEYINEHNIKVFNARGVYSIPMAEWAICKILDVYKKSFEFYDNQKNNLWKKNRNIIELNGKEALIVGYGNVGKEVAKRLHAFGVKINIVDIHKISNDIINKSFSIDNLDKAVSTADIVIISIALTAETKGLFNSKIFEQMKYGSVLVNISRGTVINEDDLIYHKDRFLSIILDVFENEPLDKENSLWKCDNVIITPHNSFVSDSNNERLYKLVIQNMEVIR